MVKKPPSGVCPKRVQKWVRTQKSHVIKPEGVCCLFFLGRHCGGLWIGRGVILDAESAIEGLVRCVQFERRPVRCDVRGKALRGRRIAGGAVWDTGAGVLAEGGGGHISGKLFPIRRVLGEKIKTTTFRVVWGVNDVLCIVLSDWTLALLDNGGSVVALRSGIASLHAGGGTHQSAQTPAHGCCPYK